MAQVWSNVGTILGSLTKLGEHTPLAAADRGDEYATLGKSTGTHTPKTTKPALATSSPLYKKIVLGVFVLIILSAGTLVALGLWGNDDNKLLTSAFDNIANLLKICIGAFVGLIGGKAVTD